MSKTNNTQKYSFGKISINLIKPKVIKVIMIITNVKYLKKGITLYFFFAKKSTYFSKLIIT